MRYTPFAAEQIRVLKSEGEKKPTKAQGKRWKAIRRFLVDVLPHHGLNPAYIKKGPELTGIRATHVGARDRIVWIATNEAAVVLMIGFVKDGDKEDTYKVVVRELQRETFDNAFAELGLPKPGSSVPPMQKAAGVGDGQSPVDGTAVPGDEGAAELLASEQMQAHAQIEHPVPIDALGSDKGAESSDIAP